MGVQQDAGELLRFLYQELITEGNVRSVSKDGLEKETGWNEHRLTKAVKYLEDKGFIHIQRDRKDFYISDLYSNAIDTVENENRFKTSFGFKIKLAIFEYSWRKEER